MIRRRVCLGGYCIPARQFRNILAPDAESELLSFVKLPWLFSDFRLYHRRRNKPLNEHLLSLSPDKCRPISKLDMMTKHSFHSWGRHELKEGLNRRSLAKSCNVHRLEANCKCLHDACQEGYPDSSGSRIRSSCSSKLPRWHYLIFILVIDIHNCILRALW